MTGPPGQAGARCAPEPRSAVAPAARSTGSSLACHHDPHAVLGAHPGPDGVIVRALLPLAATVDVVLADGRRFPLHHLHEGVFAATLPLAEVPDYRIAVAYPGPEPGSTTPEMVVDTPYRFLPTLGATDLHLIGEGRHEELWRVLGAHVREYGSDGTGFGGHRHRVRRLGAERAGRAGHRRLQPLGRARPPDALARRLRDVGAVRARRRRRHPATSSTSAGPTGGGGARPTRWPAAPSSRPPPRRWCSPPATPGGTRTGWPQRGRGERTARAGQRVRGAPRLLAARPVLPWNWPRN